MKTYKIKMKETLIDEFEIEASSKQEALDIAIEKYNDKDFQYSNQLKDNVEFSVINEGDMIKNGW